MTKLKQILTILLICCLATVVSGCWSSREFDSLALVKGIGVDLAKEEDRVKFTVQLSKPQEQQGGGQSGGAAQQFWTTSSTGYSIFEANRNLVKTVGRQPFYSHSEVVIIGEELARQGIKPYIDLFNRDPELRRRSYIAIARGEEAEKILQSSHGIESLSAIAVKQIINGQSVTETIFASDLREFTISILSDTKDTVTAPIQLKEGGPKEKESKGKELTLY
ncbi:Ger(x)C family spore germination protein [Acetohalobium arabaticum]|uniref:Ger(x)C family spore germination protein n=1 Tax=Acetohalobium arabaticum TaxID=28187 RepID=UPI0002DBCD3C|nr:hypothetical protein [Acetohalobium arabaticum]